MSQVTSFSNIVFEQIKPVFTIKEDDFLIQKAGRLLTGAIINTAITATALFEAVVCGVLAITLSPAFLLPSARGIPTFFKEHAIAAVQAAKLAAKAVFGHAAAKDKKIAEDKISTEAPFSQKMKSISQNILSYFPKPPANLQKKHYALIGVGILTCLFLGYSIYSSHYRACLAEFNKIREDFINITTTAFINDINDGGGIKNLSKVNRLIGQPDSDGTVCNLINKYSFMCDVRHATDGGSIFKYIMDKFGLNINGYTCDPMILRTTGRLFCHC